MIKVVRDVLMLRESVCVKALVGNLRQKLRRLLCCCPAQVLTDTVENNDRIIDRVTDDRQHTCDKGISNGNTKQ